MTFMTIFLQMLTLCIPIVGGIVAARAGFLDQKMNTALTRLVMNITLPCMVVASVGANETLPETPVLLTLLAASIIGYAIAAAMDLAEGPAIAISFVFFAAGFLFAALFSRRKSSKPITYEVRDIITSGAETV